MKPLNNDVLVVRFGTEPYVNIEVEGQKFKFIVDTGATMSLVKPGTWQVRIDPTDISARGITGNNLNIIGEQTVELKIGDIICEHTFLVSELGTPGNGILGVDLLQSVGASVDLVASCLRVGGQEIPIENHKGTVLQTEGILSSNPKELITPQE